MDMQLTDLRILVAVADLGSFTAAADRLRYTQSAVSRRIAGLERSAGVPLFRRAARGVVTSPAGDALLRHARTILREVDDAMSAVAAVRAGSSGPLRIGAIPTANAALVPRALALLEARRPGLEIRLREGGSVDLAAAVAVGDLDLAVVFAAPLGRHAGLELVELARDPLLVALPPGHRLSTAAEVHLSDLAGERWVQGSPDVADELFAAADPPPPWIFRVREWTAKQGFVAAGLGLTVVASLAADGVRPDVVLRPLHGAGAARRVVAVLRADAGAGSRAAVALLAEVAATLTRH